MDSIVAAFATDALFWLRCPIVRPAMIFNCAFRRIRHFSLAGRAKGTIPIRILTLALLLQVFLQGRANAIDDFGADGNEISSQADEWGHLRGRVRVEGAVDPPAKLEPDKDREYCLANGHEIISELVVVGEDGGLRDVYVMLYLARGDEPPPVHPSFDDLKKNAVVLDNKQCRFEPHAAFVRTGQVLTMRNSDSIGHNIHTLNLDEKNKTVPVGGLVDVTYEQPDRIPADVECNIHPFMKGLLLVRDDPYAAITDASGEFQIENIPAGTWKFQFWHKKTGYLSMLTRDGKPFLERRGEFSLEIKAGETVDLGDLLLSAAVLNSKD
jgi:plastocyanin